MNVFSRSWALTKTTFSIINQDRELYWYPIFAGILSLCFILAVFIPTLILSGALENESAGAAFSWILLFVIYFGTIFIATFFNVCVVYTAATRFNNGNATIGSSIGFAFKKIHLIAGWSILAATVGVLLQAIRSIGSKGGRGAGIASSVISSLLGTAWNILSIFVVPALVYHGLGPIAALKKSAQTIRKTWGESLIKYFGFGVTQFLFVFVGILIFAPVLFLSLIASFWFFIAMVIVAIIYFVGVGLTFSLANSVYDTALYVYAETGRIPGNYPSEMIQHALVPKH